MAFVSAVAMVKLTSVVLLPLLVLAWLLSLPGWVARGRALLSAAAVTVGTVVVLYAPLWAGTTMFTNVLRVARRLHHNSLWVSLAHQLASPNDKAALAVVTSQLDVVRNLFLLCGISVLVWQLARGRPLADSWAWLWFAVCLTSAYIWPWYFVLAVVPAAVCGPGRAAAVVAGLTLGGLLFRLRWTGDIRPVVLFAPALLIALMPALSRRIERSMGRVEPSKYSS
ncbi:MAG: hypothetical protein M3Q29_06635 [Chloroflexota bacterium]|nr:hypothetical protein [Chloroflexota bacterium]